MAFKLVDESFGQLTYTRIYQGTLKKSMNVTNTRERRSKRIGRLDGESFESWAAALTDYSLRLAAMGWRNALCENAFVARDREPWHGEEDLDVLSVRWPGYRPRLAQFLMDDPLHDTRAELQRRYDEAADASPQDDLFA